MVTNHERVNHFGMQLEETGFESDRERVYYLPSGEGPTFAVYAREMIERIKELRSFPLNKKEPIRIRSKL